ncbi:MAG: PEGA domain-containing protein [Acidobacteria bacterium]|nr:PEGA domain-containing protein [Acidobacteriota bacterium]MBI3658211.1 PEGA domain-containing protein [Acidobacteriota bacterium]
MRTLRFSLSAACAGFCLISSLFAFKHYKLLIRTNVEGAEVYLQGTRLDKTNRQGRLLIEQVPEGTYQVQLRKDGYEDYRSDITVTAKKETQVLHVRLRSLTMATPRQLPQDKPTKRTKAALHNRPARRPSPKAVTPPQALRPYEPLKPSDSAGVLPTDTGATAPIVLNSPGVPVRHELASSPFARHGLLLATVIAGIGVAWLLAWLWHTRRARPIMVTPVDPLNQDLLTLRAEATSGSAAYYSSESNRERGPAARTHLSMTCSERRSHPQGFMRHLRRKEELIEAGFIPTSIKPDSPGARNKAAGSIIEVTKEEYRYEENSD